MVIKIIGKCWASVNVHKLIQWNWIAHYSDVDVFLFSLSFPFLSFSVCVSVYIQMRTHAPTSVLMRLCEFHWLMDHCDYLPTENLNTVYAHERLITNENEMIWKHFFLASSSFKMCDNNNSCLTHRTKTNGGSSMFMHCISMKYHK